VLHTDFAALTLRSVEAQDIWAMEIYTDKLEVENNETERRFQTRIGEHIAFTKYYRSQDLITLVHTEVPKPLEGQGVAGKLARAALDYARSNRLYVVPQCSFMADYIRKHPEHQSLVDPDSRWLLSES
jgi:uncharacterized protein